MTTSNRRERSATRSQGQHSKHRHHHHHHHESGRDDRHHHHHHHHHSEPPKTPPVSRPRPRAKSTFTQPPGTEWSFWSLLCGGRPRPSKPKSSQMPAQQGHRHRHRSDDRKPKPRDDTHQAQQESLHVNFATLPNPRRQEQAQSHAQPSSSENERRSKRACMVCGKDQRCRTCKACASDLCKRVNPMGCSGHHGDKPELKGILKKPTPSRT